MSNADLAQMKILANGLSAVGSFEPWYCALADGQQTFGRGLPEEAPRHRRPAHMQPAPEESGVQARGLRETLIRLSAYEPLKSLRAVYGLVVNARYWRTRRREAERFIEGNAIDSVITCNDTTLHYLPALKAAQNLSRPVVLARSANIYYHDVSDGCRNSVKHGMRARMPRMRVDRADSIASWIMNWAVRFLFPHQVAATVWGKLVPYQPADLLALAFAGIRPRQLWHLGQDWTSKLIVSGDDEAEALRLYGVPKKRILPIGCVAFENIVGLLHQRDSLRAEICNRLELLPERPIVLMTVPAGWEHRMFTYEQQFGYLKDLFAIFRQLDTQVVLSLHPLSKREDYEDLASEFSLKFLDRQLIEAIVFADIFIGADNSSVLRWAIAAGMPTMNYQLNPDAVEIKLHPEFPNLTRKDDFVAWVRGQLERSPIETAELLKPGRRPMGLIAGEFFERLAQELRIYNRTGGVAHER